MFDSERLGYDTCGTYKFCGKCNKSLENPCAVAKSKYKKKKSKQGGSITVSTFGFDPKEEFSTNSRPANQPSFVARF